MARWAQYYSRGSSAANLEQKKSREKKKRMLSELSRMIWGQSSIVMSSKPAAAGSGLDGLVFSPRMYLGKHAYSCLPLSSVC